VHQVILPLLKKMRCLSENKEDNIAKKELKI
jgi:hypothetical protein